VFETDVACTYSAALSSEMTFNMSGLTTICVSIYVCVYVNVYIYILI